MLKNVAGRNLKLSSDKDIETTIDNGLETLQWLCDRFPRGDTRDPCGPSLLGDPEKTMSTWGERRLGRG
jgi:hypothetical protein